MRILHLLVPAPYGGLESVVRTLSAAQVTAGHVVAAGLVAPNGIATPLRDELEAAGVDATRLPVGGRSYLRERREVGRLCRRIQPDVVHTHGYRSDVLHGPMGRRQGIPTVSTVHGFTGGDGRNRLYERLQLRALRRSDAVVAVSAPLVDRLAAAGVPRERIWLCRNAGATVEPLPRADARARLGLGAGGPARIGWIGRLSREKGADVLLEAMPALADRDVALSIIGDGPERAALEARVAERGLTERVRWHGPVPNAAAHLGAFDVVVLSSRTEGTPMVLLEAMAAGVPVVATRVGGVPDVVSDAEALLVESEDPGALAAAIRRVLDEPEATARRAGAARARARDEHGVAAWVERHDRIYGAVTS